MPFALVTCGPAFEPIDEVRRITNQSTGELGTRLAESLSGCGFHVLCLRGEMAVYPRPKDVSVIAFSTNASLLDILENLPEKPAAVFHAAALCDFLLHRIDGAERVRKIGSAVSQLHLILRPAEKILPRLRGFFPDAIIVGWKYELEHSRQDAIARAREQITRSKSNACVINGSSYGPGFGFLTPQSEEPKDFASKSKLCNFLAAWTLDSLKHR
ncbi:MAG TPA: phosphopantothenoylcysteine decarboxylase [Terrimicrobiaceae bacterium]